MHDPLALQRLGQLADFGDQLRARRCACSRRASCCLRRRAGARGGTIPNRAAGSVLLLGADATAAAARGAALANYGLGGCSTGASTARPSCRSCSRSAIAAFSLGPRPAAAHLDARARRLRRPRAFAELQQPRRALPRHGGPGSAGDEALARACRAHAARPRRHRRRRLLGARRSTSKAQTIDGERTLDDRHRRAARLDERDADRDRRPPRRGGAAARARSCRARPRCSSSRACSPRARPSARSCSSPPAAAAAATPGAAELDSAQPARAARRGDRARRPRRRDARRPFVVPYSDGFGSAPAAAAAHGRRRDQARGRPATRGAPSAARPARPPRLPARGRRTGRARRATGCRRCWCRSPANAALRRARRSARNGSKGSAAPCSARSTRSTPPPTSPRRCRAGSCCSARRCPRGRCGCSSGTLLLPPLVAVADGLARCAAAAAAGRALDAVDAQLRAAVPRLRAVRLPARLARASSARPRRCRSCRARCRSTGPPRRRWWRSLLTFALALAAVGDARCAGSAGGRARIPRRGGLSMLLVAASLGVLVWLGNPFTALLLLPALHLWLLLASPELRPRPDRRARAGSARRCCRWCCWSPSTPTSSGSARAAWRGRRVLLIAGGHVGLARRRCCGVSRSAAWPRRRCRGDAARARWRRGRAVRPNEDRRHDPRAHVLRGPGIARWNGVGSATIGGARGRSLPQLDAPPGRDRPRRSRAHALARAVRVLAVRADRRWARWRCSTRA